MEMMREFAALGCSDKIKCGIASLVYLDLQEVKMENLEQLYNSELDLLYFRGQYQDKDPEIIVPVSKCTEMDMLQFEEMQRKLCGDLKCLTLAICDPNSTILYYSIVNGFRDK